MTINIYKFSRPKSLVYFPPGALFRGNTVLRVVGEASAPVRSRGRSRPTLPARTSTWRRGQGTRVTRDLHRTSGPVPVRGRASVGPKFPSSPTSRVAGTGTQSLNEQDGVATHPPPDRVPRPVRTVGEGSALITQDPGPTDSRGSEAHEIPETNHRDLRDHPLFQEGRAGKICKVSHLCHKFFLLLYKEGFLRHRGNPPDYGRHIVLHPSVPGPWSGDPTPTRPRDGRVTVRRAPGETIDGTRYHRPRYLVDRRRLVEQTRPTECHGGTTTGVLEVYQPTGQVRVYSFVSGAPTIDGCQSRPRVDGGPSLRVPVLEVGVDTGGVGGRIRRTSVPARRRPRRWDGK